MYWKLRIPLLLCIFGITDGLFQKFPKLFFANLGGLSGRFCRSPYILD